MLSMEQMFLFALVRRVDQAAVDLSEDEAVAAPFHSHHKVWGLGGCWDRVLMEEKMATMWHLMPPLSPTGIPCVATDLISINLYYVSLH